MERTDGETASSLEGWEFVLEEDVETQPSEGGVGAASSQDGVEAVSRQDDVEAASSQDDVLEVSIQRVFLQAPQFLMKWRQFARHVTRWKYKCAFLAGLGHLLKKRGLNDVFVAHRHRPPLPPTHLASSQAIDGASGHVIDGASSQTASSQAGRALSLWRHYARWLLLRDFKRSCWARLGHFRQEIGKLVQA